MTPHPNVQSFRRFVEEWLPQRLGEVVNLLGYEVKQTEDGACGINLTVRCNGDVQTVAFDGIPWPADEGTFTVGGVERVVAMTADRANLEQAEIRCVGEQLRDEIEPRLVALPDMAECTAEMVAAWLPLDRWIRDFLLHAPTSQPIDDTNWLARQTHLRRLYLPEDDAQFHPSQIGRVCPLETPEGPNVGRVLYLSVGAEVREERIVIVDDSPQAALGLSASMVPLLEHNDLPRQLFGCNMRRQWLPLGEHEPALVQTGTEPQGGEAWCGRNLLTAFIFWKGMNYEDGIVVSESAARKLASPEPLEIGDKLSNRHGTKGTVAAILPDDEMPHLPDGRPVELLFDMCGLHTRGNFGQVREAVLGNVANARGEPILCPPFASPSSDQIREMLREVGLPDDGQMQLVDGPGGAPLQQPSTAGYVYWGKTYHRAAEKLAVAPFSSLRNGEGPGVRQTHQRQGELENCALQTRRAYENLIENIHTRSLDRAGIDDLPAAVAAGPVAQSPPPSALFEKTRRLLRTAGIEARFDGQAVHFGFAKPGPEDLALAIPLPHPWCPEHTLTHVGSASGGRLERLRRINERAAGALSGTAPDSIRQNAREDLQTHVREVLEGLDLNYELRLGNQVLFSGRSVITPGYDLKLGEVGLPKPMAWALFGPFVERAVGAEQTRERTPEARKALLSAMAERVVLLNRAPTLQVTNITAFRPVLREGLSIRLHPLCCRLFNADFDGDQMAVLLPVTDVAQAEAKEKLTLEGHLAFDPGGVLVCLAPTYSHLYGLAWAALNDERRPDLLTRWPSCLPEPPRDLTWAWLVGALNGVLEAHGAPVLLETLQALLGLGTELATRSGASLHPFIGEGVDLPPTPGHRWPGGWYWYSEGVNSAILSQADLENPNLGPQALLVRSAARGNAGHLRQLIGPRGLVGSSPWGGPVVRSGLRDGLTAQEYFDCVPRTRASLGAAHGDVMAWTFELRKQLWPKSDTVLARAFRARDPGPIFGQAALKGETDPLTDPGVRLWMGMRP